MVVDGTLGCDKNRMSLLSKVSNIVQNIFYLYDVTDFTESWHLIPVATECTGFTQKWHLIPVATECTDCHITVHCTHTDTASETPAKTHFVVAQDIGQTAYPFQNKTVTFAEILLTSRSLFHVPFSFS